MRFQLIDACRADMPIRRACRLLSVSQSGYYAWRDRPASPRQRDDMVLLAHIRNAFALSNETYGSPRMTRELQEEGLCVGRRRVARLMRDNDLQARRKRRFRRTTDSRHSWPITPNILGGDFSAEHTNQKWGVDISYVWTREGWLYLAIVMDLFSRRIIGWSTSDRLKRDLALEAFRRAVALREPPPGLIHHSDRGSQYCSIDYRTALNNIGAIASMSGKGNCYDNAVVETFFKTIKSELIWRTVFHTRRQAETEIARYIDGFYNPVRRHSTCDYQSPIKYEMMA